MTGLLEPLGFRVIEAIDGEDALEKLELQDIDLMVTDLVMPGMNGFDLLKRMGQLSQLDKVVAIASSASVFEADQFQSLDAGASAFLPKPIQTEKLLALIEKYLKLEWIYEADQSDFLTTVVPNHSVTPPPPEVLKSLSKLVQMGDTDAIVEQASNLLEEHPQAKNFALQVKHLAELCYMDDLEKLINANLSQEAS